MTIAWIFSCSLWKRAFSRFSQDLKEFEASCSRLRERDPGAPDRTGNPVPDALKTADWMEFLCNLHCDNRRKQ